MKRSISIVFTLVLVFPLILSACGAKEASTITASGTLSSLDISIAPEIGGRVVDIYVDEGDTVQVGDELFRIDDEFLKAQYEQTKAAVEAANATLSAAQAQLVYVQNQRDLAVQGAHLLDAQNRQNTWSESVPTDYRPGWYFQKSELILSAQAEVDAAQADLVTEKADLEKELKDASNQDFIAAEERLARAQAALTVAQTTLTQANQSNEANLQDVAQDNFDIAQSELDAALLEYDRMLSTSAADAVLLARARVAIAQARSDNARDALTVLQTGDESTQVSAAEASVTQARAAVTQAEANLSQAKAALELVNLQLERVLVKAPMDGVILARDLEVGELVAAGGVVMTLAQLKDMELIVYIPEDQYGQVSIGQQVGIEVDSFPGEVFIGNVVRIANQAEFTPRNIQTSDSRTSTVYAVTIKVPNTDQRLKPGMPVDVTYIR